MKKTMLILAVLALVLILIVGVLLWQLLSLGGGGRQTAELPQWIEGHWSVVQLRSWDPETGALELDYPLRFTYAQMEKYGPTIPEVCAIPEGNRDTVAALRTDLGQSLGLRDLSITLYGVTTDGRTAYTLHPDGSLETCWEEPKN